MADAEKNMLPVAEVFESIQGEGFWTGQPMRFVRLAGCPVGRKASQDWGKEQTPQALEGHPILSNGTDGSMCRTWDGRYFCCDTDFSVHTYAGVDELLNTHLQHICLTGGEPLIHQQRLIELGFFRDAFAADKMVHIETSGTVQLLPCFIDDKRVWITVAPKHGYLDKMIFRANEVKLLVDENFTKCIIPTEIMRHQQVYLCPINEETEVNQHNAKLAVELAMKFNWKVSCQWHKMLGLR